MFYCTLALWEEEKTDATSKSAEGNVGVGVVAAIATTTCVAAVET